MVSEIGLIELRKISRGPAAHLFDCIIMPGTVDAADLRNDAGSVIQYIDFHPFLWIPSPVRISSD